jgi:Helix-turn-helix domain
MFFQERVMDTDFECVKIVVFPDGRLDTENAARYLGLSPKTLAMMRTAGTGPKFVKRGRVFYYLEDLQAWVAEQPRVRSTSQARLGSMAP